MHKLYSQVREGLAEGPTHASSAVATILSLLVIVGCAQSKQYVASELGPQWRNTNCPGQDLALGRCDSDHCKLRNDLVV